MGWTGVQGHHVIHQLRDPYNKASERAQVCLGCIVCIGFPKSSLHLNGPLSSTLALGTHAHAPGPCKLQLGRAVHVVYLQGARPPRCRQKVST